MIKLRVNQPPIGKARPRVERHHTRMPKKYCEWMENAIASLRGQWEGKQPLDQKSGVQLLLVQCFGNHAGVDTDNIAGSVMDALVKAGVLKNDNVNIVPVLLSAWERSRKLQWIEVEIYFEWPFERRA